MPETEVAQTTGEFEPTTIQLERLAQQKRFTWLAIYTPVIITVLIILALVILMIWAVLSPTVVGTADFISGVADIIIIATTIPMILLCLLPPAAMIGLIVYRRQNRPEGVQYGRLQTLFWRIDKFITTVNQKTDETLPKVAKPVVQFNSLIAGVQTAVSRLTKNQTND